MALKIYTKTGDDGTTGLFGGGRVPKDALRIECYGDVDELNSALGLVLATTLEPIHRDILAEIQSMLFILGADLATPPQPEGKKLFVPRVTAREVECLERTIDRLEERLPELQSFILPGGTPAGAALHMARTICRRAERRLVTLLHHEPEAGMLPLLFLNRLSDTLFVVARSVNFAAGLAETEWHPAADNGAAE